MIIIIIILITRTCFQTYIPLCNGLNLVRTALISGLASGSKFKQSLRHSKIWSKWLIPLELLLFAVTTGGTVLVGGTVVAPPHLLFKWGFFFSSSQRIWNDWSVLGQKSSSGSTSTVTVLIFDEAWNGMEIPWQILSRTSFSSLSPK